MARDRRPMRESRRTYRRRRCSYVEDSGWRCRRAPTVGSAYCLLHEPATTEGGAMLLRRRHPVQS